jgi:molecular chaperone GrpE
MSDYNKKIPNHKEFNYEGLDYEKNALNVVDNSNNAYDKDQSLEQDLSKEENLDKNNQVEQLEKQLLELDDRYKRLYADFENLKRRSAKEKLDLMLSANEKILKKILPILDDFERAISASLDSDKDSTFYSGIKLIHNKFVMLLEQSNVKTMNSNIGDDFDPNLHEAITSLPHNDINMKGKIVEIVEKGFHLNENVLRFAKVIIAS